MKSRILPIIAGSFALVSLIQITNMSLANAREDTAAVTETSDQNAALSADGIENGNVCLTHAIADALMEEKAVLQDKQMAMVERESVLQALEKTLDQKIENLEDTKKSIEAQLAKIDKIANNDIAHLIAMYETMKPKKAAEIFNNMAPSFAAGFLIDMNSTRAGLIMSEMETKKSYEVSLVIASRNAHLRKSKTPA